MKSQAALTAIGSYVPEKRLTNDDLAAMVDTNDEWITRRTGIKERRIARADEFSSHLAIAAARNLIERYEKSPENIDAILVATTTPDMPFPSVASRIQEALGAPNCLSLDLNAACAGFVAALQMANGLILTGAYRSVLVVGVETLSKITDYTDRTTCILFGDGAGAALVERSEEGQILASDAATAGSGGSFVYATGLSAGWKVDDHAADGKIVQNGREVYKWAVTQVPLGVRRLLAAADRRLEELDRFVPHSANLRMVDAMCERLGLPAERALTSAETFGNTSAASIPLALDLAVRDGRLTAGQLVALYGFGSGLTQAGLLLNWTMRG
jgi:3-oxoacyl-[acyl-carrier-protein] synthase-3